MRLRLLMTAVVSLMSNATSAASCAATSTEDASVTHAYLELERRLLEAASLRLDATLTASGALSCSLQGWLVIEAGNRVQLAFSGQFNGKPVQLQLTSDGTRMRGGLGADEFDEPTPDALNEALILGITRMGLLHNLAMLTSGAPPDRADGTLREWVQPASLDRGPVKEIDGAALRSLTFEVLVARKNSARATLWLSSETDLPVYREQVVRFSPERVMRVHERYGSFSIQNAKR